LGNRITHRPPAVEWGVAMRPLPGEAVSGDLHLVKPFAGGVLLAAVDGLGRGNQAAMAAKTAVSVLGKYASDPVVSLAKRCHKALLMTRGVVMMLASLNLQAGDMSWLGIGNVEGILLRADAAAVPSLERAPLHGGLVGYQLPVMHARKVPVREGDLVIFATDGISGDFIRDVRREDPPQKVAELLLKRHFKGNDDALVLVLRYPRTSRE